MIAESLRILVVEARLYGEVADELLRGAKAALAAADAQADIVTVPGVLEIPAVIAMAEEDGHRPAGARYDGYVALGCVVRGETAMFEMLAEGAMRALLDLAIGKRLAIGQGVLAVASEAEGLTLAKADAGAAAANACLAVIGVRRRLLGQAT